MAIGYKVQNELGPKVGYWVDLFFAKYLYMVEINKILKNRAKLLPSIPKSPLAAVISEAFQLSFSSAY